MTDFLSMTPEQLEKDFMLGTSGTTDTHEKDNEPEKTANGGVHEEEETKKNEVDSTPLDSTPQAEGDQGKTQSEVSPPNVDASANNSDTKPLNMQEVHNVTEDAFKDAYDYFDKNAVGDPKTRQKYLGELRNDLAEYEENENGTKSVTRGLLKNFTDDNYQNALKAGETVINTTLSQLSSTKYPSFEAFKTAREKAAASVHSRLQNSVAYPELSAKFLKSLEDLSNKKGLEFNLSETEKEKEKLIMAEGKKNVDLQKKHQEGQEAVMNSQQVQKNIETERRLFQEQSEKQAREFKERIDLEAQLRRLQIERDLKAGFEERAKTLHEEITMSTNQQTAMMMQMQKDSMEQQAKLTQMLTLEMNKQPPPPPPNPPGLLTTILAPVANFLGNVLGKLL
jgi:hypothetical protein